MTERPPDEPLDAQTEGQLADAGGEFEPDFTDQTIMTDPSEASGANSSGEDDPASGGDAVYAPPMDPVVTTDAHGRTEILGGFGSGEDEPVERSASDGRVGDEALADAVRRRLAEDSATTDLRITVVVRKGVAHLHGLVSDMDDADNAESVAASVPGIREVVEELEVANV
ncbi:MAG: BON domain-containing protein [Chloroflexi bacterium]|nr:BON domain-containing protein [Chloroflexota bacterium]